MCSDLKILAGGGATQLKNMSQIMDNFPTLSGWK